MTIRRLCLLWLLVIPGTCLPAAMPAPWPVELASRELGWRFKDEFAVWPGLYWRGQGQPPVAAQPDDPATWGSMRLGGKIDPAPAPQLALTDLTVPLVDDQAIVDGLLGWEEWSRAAAAVENLDCGQSWVVLAEHTPETLYLCLAAPSQTVLRKNQVVEVYLTPADAEGRPLTRAARQFRVRAGREDRPELLSLSLQNGVWCPDATVKDVPLRWRGGASGRGDGAWGFAVFELGIPLTETGCEAGAPVPEQFRFMARLQTLSHGDAVGGVKNADPESVVWPDNRTSWTSPTRTAAALRPDYWQRLLFDSKDAATGFMVPGTTRPIKVDGQIGIKEWADARVADYNLPGDQWRRVWLTRDANSLYVAVRVHLARGLRTGEACQIYVDPVGDGGLQPRGDDLELRLPLGPDCPVEMLRVGAKGWEPCGPTEVKGASYPISTYESAYEFALPLQTLGPDLRPNLAVEVVYGLPK